MHEKLTAAIEALPVNVRTAFYVAAKKRGVIRRGTWNGCAFNAATQLKGFESNAEHFGIDPTLVRHFISAWDGSNFSSDVSATQWLCETLLELGVDTDLVTSVTREHSGSYIKNITKINVFTNESLAEFNNEVASLIDSFTDVEEEKSEIQQTVEALEAEFDLACV